MPSRDSQPSSPQASLAFGKFEEFMLARGAGWTLVSKNEKFLSYQKISPPHYPDFFVAFILLLLWFVPGILYIILARRPAETHQLVVSWGGMALIPSGDAMGLGLYSKFLDIQNGRGVRVPEEGTRNAIDWVEKHKLLLVIIVVVAITVFVAILFCLYTGQ